MLNLKKSVESRGVVVIAFNTQIDYVSIADQTSRLITHFTGMPVTLITESTSKPKFKYDQIIQTDSHQSNYRLNNNYELIDWKNFNRWQAYELSPYDKTLLVDCDYLMLDDNLIKLFDTEFDYRIMHCNQISKGPTNDHMGRLGLPMVWATAVLFKKTARAKMFFNLIGRIQRNYNYYRQLYNIREQNYRNDYAFAIANIILNGYSIDQHQSIPWSMFSIFDSIDKIDLDGCLLKVSHGDTATVIPKQNIHILDKKYLQSSNFQLLVDRLCES